MSLSPLQGSGVTSGVGGPREGCATQVQIWRGDPGRTAPSCAPPAPAPALGKRQAPPADAPHCHQALHSALGHRVLAQPTDSPPFVTLRGVGVLSPRPGFSGTSVCLAVPRSGASPGECRVQDATLFLPGRSVENVSWMLSSLQVWISGEVTQFLSGLGGLSFSSPQGTSRFETCLLEDIPLGIRVAPGLDLRVRGSAAPLSLPRRLLEQLGVQSKNECGPGKNQWSRGAFGCRENIPEGQHFAQTPHPGLHQLGTG